MTGRRRGFVIALVGATFVGLAPSLGCRDDVSDPLRRGRQVGDGADASSATGDNPANGFPFEPLAPNIYVAKVKNLLVGLPPTDAEVEAVLADPTSLRGLIDGWMALPQFKAKMIDFFRNAFQQNHASLLILSQSTNAEYIDNVSNIVRTRLERSMMDSFALTAWELVNEGRPLNETITTSRYMLNPPLMSLMARIDEYGKHDNPSTDVDRLRDRNAIARYVYDVNTTATLADTLNPSSPNYMVWKVPHAPCSDGPVTHVSPGDHYYYVDLQNFIFGLSIGNAPCTQFFEQIPSQFTDADWSDWRMVTIHPTDAGTPYTTPASYDLVKAHSATDMWLKAPHVGFMGTLAFEANWLTNLSNSSRVTANQTLIVALGLSINGTGAPPATVDSPAIDTSHAGNPVCASCHTTLDPYRQFFRQSQSVYYSDQADKSQLAIPAAFDIAGVSAKGQGIGDLANILASHPHFAPGWVQKLHFWANTLPAQEDDPEFLRVAQVFQASHYDFKTLVRELFSSPLITYAGPTATTQSQGVILSIARRDHYCASLSNRFGLSDVCGMTQATPTKAQIEVGGLAELIPIDTYYRASALPSLATDPNLFFRGSVEKMCLSIADQIIDVTGPTKRYDSAQPDSAITDFVTTMAGLAPGDPRADSMREILKDNFAQSLATGAKATDALKSTFTVACVAPTSVMVGQ